jgi:endoglucanase
MSVVIMMFGAQASAGESGAPTRKPYPLPKYEPLFVETPRIIASAILRERSGRDKELDDAASFTISSDDDPDYKGGKPPARVGRWSRGVRWLKDGLVVVNYVYLVLPQPLKEGKTYAVKGPAGAPELKYKDDGPLVCVDPIGPEGRTRELKYKGDLHASRAVKANQIGYIPDGPKIAYLGDWLGTLGKLELGADGKPFEVVDVKTGKAVFAGKVVRNQAELADAHGSELYELDFTDFKTPGTYVVSVPGVGASDEFRVAEDAYDEVATTVQRALYHQRCGCALEAKYTRYTHGVCHRNKVTISDCSCWDAASDGCAELPKKDTGVELKDAWGGWHDAGDYMPRGPQHISIPGQLLRVYEACPRKFVDSQYNIPESGNGIPDIVDEARWGIDFWSRLQDPNDGGVYPGIEVANDGGNGFPENKIPMFAWKKDEAISLSFAGLCALASRIYAKLGKKEDAASLLERAEKAYGFAVARYAAIAEGKGFGKHKDDKFAAAALELYRTTKNERYLKDFRGYFRLRTAGNLDAIKDPWDRRGLAGIACSYILATDCTQDPELVATCRQLLTSVGETAIQWVKLRGYPLGRDAGYPIPGWIAAPGADLFFSVAVGLGDKEGKKYRDYALRVADYWLGCNPMGMTYITGVGHRYPQNPLHGPSIQAIKDGLADVPVPGIPIGGPNACDAEGLDKVNFFVPPASQTPKLMMYRDVVNHPPCSEFTVNGTMGPCAALFGWLSSDKPDRK